MPSHIYLAQFATAVTVIPKEGDHRLSTEVTSLDGAPSLLAFMLLWGVSRRFLTHRSHFSVLPRVRQIILKCPAPWGFSTSAILMSRNKSRPTSQSDFSQSRPTSSGWWMPQPQPRISWRWPTCKPASRPKHYVLWEGYLCTQTQDLTSPDGCSINHRESNPGPLL